ncbi:MAG: hypothetical protein QF890_05170 [Myxococcota bacterium]|jgi:predicted LPLAT superfamily acyltransferase|nr:hypothetical protein [Myxococcota bacterium]MDP7431951.1 hypothetical protein [Myxococcota bacterium]|tara:strand:+ start:79 stop:207 length:129 start_codon:yes stop_codon:yes gene_type:complete
MLALRVGTNRYSVHTEKLTEEAQLPRSQREKDAAKLLTTYAH